ncbi:hypothetical protein IO44_03115 [Gallibacterium anatis str. Avicor]|uniref:hypothetical protein n=1 Tax=Gallibacterium anatis TaxID=750 RepID=UPI000531A55D|nr:hypothetical protein [Gallibacterium anatis]KGQ56317.1 hypothetical protein IO44_03115 [Gallibacterium anatis str. Avicor]
MKKFNLNEALDGKPVQLRDGRKAFVKAVIEQPKDLKQYTVIGHARNGNNEEFLHWDTNGNCIPDVILDDDIVGMWEYPKRFINGIEVPEPVTEETWVDGVLYYYVKLTFSGNTDCDAFLKRNEFHEKLINDGLVFKTKEGAEAMAKALLNYKVEVKNE